MLLLFFVVAAAVLCLPAHAGSMVLSEAQSGYVLGPHLDILEDQGGQLTFEDIRSDIIAPSFRPGNASALNVGFTRSAYWLRTGVRNTHPEVGRWILEFGYTLIDRVDLYIVYDDGKVVAARGGDTVPFSERPVKHRHTMFDVPLRQGQSAQLYLRVQSESSMQMPLTLWSPQGLLAADHEKQYSAGIYYGIVVAMLLYNLLIWLSIRDINYLYYANYICGWILFQMSIDGFAFEYLWPDHPAWGNIATPFFIGYVYCAITLFSREFLQLKQNMPRTDRVFQFMFGYFVLVMLAALFLSYATAIKAGTFGALVGAALIFGTGAACLKNGVRQAKYFMLAWSALLLSILIYALRTFGILPQIFITEYGLPIGSALEVILLSFALAHRMRLLKQENERIQRHAHETLELSVRQRTVELDHALERLAQANKQLTGLSYTDGLTGAKNRAYFDKMLRAEWQRALRAGGPVALLLLDIDHFKNVNDTYGHLAGDACLKSLVETVQRILRRPGDEVFRYGGEEFVVLLPGADADGASSVAEQIRRRIEAMSVLFEDRQIAITASVGVSSMLPSSDADPETLVAHADAAMYVAKHGGRNRVSVYSSSAEVMAQ